MVKESKKVKKEREKIEKRERKRKKKKYAGQSGKDADAVKERIEKECRLIQRLLFTYNRK